MPYKDPIEKRDYLRRYYQRDREKLIKRSRNSIFKRKYGITLEQYEELKKAAGSLCALCGKSAPLYYDHDHVTGKFRAWLCGNCNLGLGNFQDDPRLLEKAILYLQESRCVA